MDPMVGIVMTSVGNVILCEVSISCVNISCIKSVMAKCNKISTTCKKFFMGYRKQYLNFIFRG